MVEFGMLSEEEMNKKKELAIHEKDTGSSEVQVAQLTYKIEKLSNHIKNNKKSIPFFLFPLFIFGLTKFIILPLIIKFRPFPFILAITPLWFLSTLTMIYFKPKSFFSNNRF